MYSKEKELAMLKKDQAGFRRDRICSDSKNRLKNISRKKFNTCFIFAISEFERIFGMELWGHGLDEDNLNNNHKANKILWDLVRKNILDKGNTQARAMGMEIDLHSVEFEGYQMQLKGVFNEK